MLNRLKKNNQGFTIIEVMIVLAIAGLIMLIVFLAVPALQRSSRNTQRKNDIASLAGAVSNYISNNNGAVPDTVTLAGGTATVKCANGGANGSVCDKTDTNVETAKVGAFTAIAVPTSPSTSTTAPDTNTVEYVPGWTCNSSNTGLGSTSARSAAFVYQIETGSSAANECQEQ